MPPNFFGTFRVPRIKKNGRDLVRREVPVPPNFGPWETDYGRVAKFICKQQRLLRCCWCGRLRVGGNGRWEPAGDGVQSAQRRRGGPGWRNVHDYLLPATGRKEEEILRRLFGSSAGSLAVFLGIVFGRPGRFQIFRSETFFSEGI